MVENIQKGLPQTSSVVREVSSRIGGGGSRHPSDARRRLLCRTIPSVVRVMSQPQECQGKEWYEHVNWTYGDYYDELHYITYDYE